MRRFTDILVWTLFLAALAGLCLVTGGIAIPFILVYFAMASSKDQGPPKY